MEWLTTGEAADMLGTSTTTIRAMAARGELVHRTTSGQERQKWAISRDSAQSWLAANGRIDERRHSRKAASAQDADVRQQLASMTQQYRYLQADHDRLSEEVAVLRAVALQLRARNAAVSEAESHQAEAAKLLLDATRAQARATEALRRGLSAQDDALGQFLVPGPPGND
jgi:excisionase family DNA binding protein